MYVLYILKPRFLKEKRIKYLIGRDTEFPIELPVRQSKTSDQLLQARSLIKVFAGHPVGSQGSKVSKWIAKTDQPAKMHRLI